MFWFSWPWGMWDLSSPTKDQAFSGGSDGKESTCNLGDLGSIPGWEDPLEEGMATHSSIFAWRIPIDRGVCRATVHRVAKSWTQLNDWAEHTCMWGRQNCGIQTSLDLKLRVQAFLFFCFSGASNQLSVRSEVLEFRNKNVLLGGN